jgi:hypothetical protein
MAGRQSAIRMRSVMIFGKLTQRYDIRILKHFPPGVVLFQLYANGLHETQGLINPYSSSVDMMPPVK